MLNAVILVVLLQRPVKESSLVKKEAMVKEAFINATSQYHKKNIALLLTNVAPYNLTPSAWRDDNTP
jgi:hypothetical protein